MRIAEAAKVVGVSAGLLRRLEREGKLPPAPRDLGRQRRYEVEDVARIRELLIRRPAKRESGT